MSSIHQTRRRQQQLSLMHHADNRRQCGSGDGLAGGRRARLFFGQ